MRGGFAAIEIHAYPDQVWLLLARVSLVGDVLPRFLSAGIHFPQSFIQQPVDNLRP